MANVVYTSINTRNLARHNGCYVTSQSLVIGLPRHGQDVGPLRYYVLA